MRCANPACSAESLYFRDGSLYWIDVLNSKDPFACEGGAQKLIWLCRDCSSHFVVQTWRPPGQQIRRRNKDCVTQANGKAKNVPLVDPEREYAKAS